MVSSDRVSVITGGSGGLGQALATRLAARGHRLAITYLVPEEASVLENALQLDETRLLLRRVDCTDSEALGRFMKEAAAEFGAIHVLCCLVGGWAGGRDVEETDDVRFERMLDLNLRSTFFAIRAAIPFLRHSGWGRILTVGSRAAFDTPAGQAAFNLSKAAVVALTKSVAQELTGSKITANVVIPSVIDTPATRSALPYASYVHWPTPEEIAGVMDFLVSEASMVMNGAAVPVYGES